MRAACDDIATLNVRQRRQQDMMREGVNGCLHAEHFFLTGTWVLDQPWHFDATTSPVQHHDELVGQRRQLADPRVRKLALHDELVDERQTLSFHVQVTHDADRAVTDDQCQIPKRSDIGGALRGTIDSAVGR